MEGFVEAVAQEVAPFHIEFTLVEPGPAKTNFGGGLVRPPAMAEYDHTPAGQMRQALTNGSFTYGDPDKMVDAMLRSVDQSPAPRRLTLGRDAYTRIRAALVERLAALDAQKEIAFSTELDG
jgi:NAD(P)-dependent dehydrogenase (short-subunit alcohol dehydrogenase family)